MSHSVDSSGLKIYHFLGVWPGGIKIWGPQFAQLSSGSAKGTSLGLLRGLQQTHKAFGAETAIV